MGVEVTPPDRSSTGGWDPLIRFPLVPVAAAMLPDGKVRALLLRSARTAGLAL